MTPVYEQVRSFLTDSAYHEVRDEALLEPRHEVMCAIIDGVNIIIRSTRVETTDKLYQMKPVDIKWKTLRKSWFSQDIPLTVHAIALTKIEEPIWRSNVETNRILVCKKM